MKTLKFIGTSLDELKKFPIEARRCAGFELDAVQRGNMPTDFKPMPSIGEIRINEQGAWRVIYVAKFSEAVYVLHARKLKRPEKKTLNLRLNAITNW